MNCKNCRIKLDEYLAGEITEEDSFEICAHLSTCESCEAVCADLSRENEMFARYLNGVEAPPNLWEGIRVELEHRQRNSLARRIGRLSSLLRFGGRLGQAATVGLVLFVSFGVLIILKDRYSGSDSAELIASSGSKQILGKGEPANGRDVSNHDVVIRHLAKEKVKDQNAEIRKKSSKRYFRKASAKNRRASSKFVKIRSAARSPKLVSEVEREYIKAVSRLSSEITDKGIKLSPKLNSMIRTSDFVIKKTREAVSKEPRNPEVVQYMASAYTKKIELLRMIVEP